MIDSFGLARERTKRCFYKDRQKLAKYKQAYSDFRNYYNADKSNVIALYLLTYYSFSQLMRFNSDGNFNMPVGMDCFCEENREYIRNGCKYFSNKYLEIYNMDYAELVNQILINADSNTFFYLDPPYINTTATYNENDGWTVENQNQLYDILNQINYKGCKFALSNVSECRGVVNTELLEFAKTNTYHIHTFDDFTYTACGKGNSNATEILITNY